jgi:hypothetical protein
MLALLGVLVLCSDDRRDVPRSSARASRKECGAEAPPRVIVHR